MTFMKLKSSFEDLLNKKARILSKMANELVDAIVDRVKKGQTTHLAVDIDMALSELNNDEKVTVLKEALVIMSRQVKGTSHNNNDDDDAGGIASVLKRNGF